MCVCSPFPYRKNESVISFIEIERNEIIINENKQKKKNIKYKCARYGFKCDWLDGLKFDGVE